MGQTGQGHQVPLEQIPVSKKKLVNVDNLLPAKQEIMAPNWAKYIRPLLKRSQKHEKLVNYDNLLPIHNRKL